ncbi:TM0996/MTH895 family glutaredoxin-like protein [Desulfallas sp. Bu1-1]|uniref:thioredoxin family protein n=1 Tax=Desulfallas sp. Bu1-1 TaxID=2787620 RepID=UPI0018A1070C|nr:thioredoxin family protein [Desulfallas sp. Bu1-1]MBF7084597.1 TM0996/MTH895 family glutaredoxin-like protein [Desulfallas sp. Bu1-1]
MEIKVLGPGCKNCKALEKTVLEAVAELNIDASVEKVEDPGKIVEAGVMMTPGLIINGKIKSTGKVPKKDAVKKMIQEEL